MRTGGVRTTYWSAPLEVKSVSSPRVNCYGSLREFTSTQDSKPWSPTRSVRMLYPFGHHVSLYCLKSIWLTVLFYPLWEPTSKGSPHLQTQIQVVPILSYLYNSLNSFSPSPVHLTGFPFCFFPDFLAIFTLSSSNNNNYFHLAGLKCEVDVSVCETKGKEGSPRCMNGGRCNEGPGLLYSCDCNAG